MKGKQHLLASSLFFLGLYWAIEAITLSMIFAPIVLTLYPDIDQHLGSHRNWFFHSILLWVILFWFNPEMLYLLFIVAVGFHCLCDITPFPSKWTGYYCVKWWKHGLFPAGKKGGMSTGWYLGNFILAGAMLYCYLFCNAYNLLTKIK